MSKTRLLGVALMLVIAALSMARATGNGWNPHPSVSFGVPVKESLANGGAIAPDLPLLSPMFGDHMVLQRGKPNTIWGWARSGSKMRVKVGGKTAETVAGSDGKWIATIVPPKTGGPYTLTVDGPTQVTLSDVMVGDVWLCTGQSNMEFGITQAKDGEKEVAAADRPNIRLYMAPRQVGYVPQPINPAVWKVCSPSSVIQGGWGGFSAVGYYFGRELNQELGIPIGLVMCSWGGTSAEAWTSEQALRPIGDFNGVLDTINGLRDSGAPAVGTYTDMWLSQHDAGTMAKPGWQNEAFPTDTWSTTAVPDGFKDLGLQSEDGVVWFRKEVNLPNPLPAGTATLHLGRIGDVDTTWVNGKLLGYSSGESYPRAYWLWSGSIQPGRNVFAVRVFDTGGPGGFLSPSEDIYVQLGDGTRIPLGGEWKGKLGANLKDSQPAPRDFEPNPTVPTVLNYGMVAPIAPLAIRGAIWYQGETNAGRSYQYRKLLPALIGDWRSMFAQGDFPFYIVSLANFTERRDQPGDDGWAELREAQAMTAQKVKHSGLAITIDIGEALDVHPKDKQTVGHRLAVNALALEYGKKIPYSGPVYKSMKVEGASVRLRFTHTDQGLVMKDASKAFAIAGQDRKWHWADAKIEGDTIVVTSPEVDKPIAVRYAWQMNPPAPLYNGAGLPAVPFRTDDWPGQTINNK